MKVPRCTIYIHKISCRPLPAPAHVRLDPLQRGEPLPLPLLFPLPLDGGISFAGLPHRDPVVLHLNHILRALLLLLLLLGVVAARGRAVVAGRLLNGRRLAVVVGVVWRKDI